MAALQMTSPLLVRCVPTSAFCQNVYIKKSQVLHESTFIFSDETTLVNYQTKTRNATKRAVDTLDKMAHQYSCKDTKLAIGPVVQCLDLGTIAARVIWAKFFSDH